MRVHFVGSVRSVLRSSASTTPNSTEPACSGSGTSPSLLELGPLVDDQRCVAPVVEDHVRAVTIGPESICSVHHQYSSSDSPFHANTGTPCGSSSVPSGTDGDGRRRVVLRREDVARRPPHLGAELDQRLDEHGGLDRHVQRAGDARTCERLARTELGSQARAGRASRARRGGSPCGRTGRVRQSATRKSRRAGGASVVVTAPESTGQSSRSVRDPRSRTQPATA